MRGARGAHSGTIGGRLRHREEMREAEPYKPTTCIARAGQRKPRQRGRSRGYRHGQGRARGLRHLQARFLRALRRGGFDPANLEAVLITHDHTDHTKGLGVVLRGLAKLGIEPAVFADDAVRAASKEIIVLEGACDLRASPRATRCRWRHAGARLPHVSRRGIVVRVPGRGRRRRGSS